MLSSTPFAVTSRLNLFCDMASLFIVKYIPHHVFKVIAINSSRSLLGTFNTYSLGSIRDLVIKMGLKLDHFISMPKNTQIVFIEGAFLDINKT